jgi:hypothetical protein
MPYSYCLILIVVVIAVCFSAKDPTVFSREIPALKQCGHIYEPPFAIGKGAPRKCGEPVPRRYTRRYRGLGFEILDSESEACFVPDQEYRLLDEIVDAIVKNIRYDPSLTERQAKVDQARQISKR